MSDLDKLDRRTIPLNWDLYTFGLMFLFSIILIFRWNLLPTFIDIYYHLTTMLGFNTAGGFVARAFWEYAPVGRPHVYPPLLHFIMLIFFKIGLGPINVARLMELVMYPLVLVTLWQVVRQVFYPRIAFFCVLIAISAYPFYLSIVDFLAASLAIVFGLLTFLCIEKRRILAASVILAFCFYTHSSTSVYIIIVFLLYAVFNRARLKSILVVNFGSIILALPLFIHQFNSIRYIEFGKAVENFPFELNFLIYLLAILGLVISLNRDKRYLFFLSLSIPSVVFLNYRYRFLCGQGSLGFILLAALSIDRFYEKLTQLLSKKAITKSFFYSLFSIIVAFFILFAPTISVHKAKVKFNLFNSTYLNLAPQIFRPSRANEFSIYYLSLFKEAVEIVKKNTSADDIIYCNEPYIGGLLSVLTGRPTSGAMLGEIKPFEEFDPISSAKIVAWFRKPDIYQARKLEFIKKRYKLREIAQTPALLIFENPHTKAKLKIPKPILPSAVFYSILSIMVGLIVLDSIRPVKGGRSH